MGNGHHLTPGIDGLPFVDRAFSAQDPHRAGDGRLEANMVALLDPATAERLPRKYAASIQFLDHPAIPTLETPDGR